MTARENFLRVLSFQRPEGRLPMLEWGAFWDKTQARWWEEGLPRELDTLDALAWLGLDRMNTLRAGASMQAPLPKVHGGPVVEGMEDYEALCESLYSDALIDQVIAQAQALEVEHQRGSLIQHLWLDGYFWFPRTLLGIEGHLYAFYDEPELMHRINEDLTAFNIRVIERLFPHCLPDMVVFAEDISYNHGPMISRELFDAFITPYYRRIVPVLKERGVTVLMDSDGDITEMVPWLEDAGIEGIGPLERQAGVDIVRIRKDHPRFIMFGGYDKMVMTRGVDAMRDEFERIYPVMRSGGYLPMVDHQTPPGVSLEAYHAYISLYRAYAERAALPE